MILAQNVSLIYPGGVVGLEQTSLKIEQGELVYITGPSGSGKTSLLKLILGMEMPTTGVISVMDEVIDKKSIQNIRKNIGPVFQEFRLIKGRTVMDNILLGMRFLDISSKKMKENAIESLHRVGLAHKEHTKIETLSFGECQRVTIARAVSRKPQLILADEPTGNLDKENALNILHLLSSFKDQKTTVVITTHATHLIDEYRPDVHIEMDQGKLYLQRNIQS